MCVCRCVCEGGRGRPRVYIRVSMCVFEVDWITFIAETRDLQRVMTRVTNNPSPGLTHGRLR